MDDKLFSKLRMPSYHDNYDYDHRYSVGAMGGRPNRRDCWGYALQVLHAHLHDVEQSNPATIHGRSELVAVARGALEETDKLIRSYQYMKDDEQKARSESYRLSTLLDAFRTAPTTVTVRWSQEAEDWCAAQTTGKYVMVRDGSKASFAFDSLDAAALFKLHWHE